MSKLSMIIEGLRFKNIEESSKINESSFEDKPICTDTRKLEKFLSEEMTKKLSKVFNQFGGFGFDVDLYASYDEDSLTDDVLSDMTVAIVFDEDIVKQSKDIANIIKKTLRNFPDFKFDKRDMSFYFEVESSEDIIDAMDSFSSFGIRIDKRLYYVEDASDIEDRYDSQMREWEEEKRDMEREYNRSRL